MQKNASAGRFQQDKYLTCNYESMGIAWDPSSYKKLEAPFVWLGLYVVFQAAATLNIIELVNKLWANQKNSTIQNSNFNSKNLSCWLQQHAWCRQKQKLGSWIQAIEQNTSPPRRNCKTTGRRTVRRWNHYLCFVGGDSVSCWPCLVYLVQVYISEMWEMREIA